MCALALMLFWSQHGQAQTGCSQARCCEHPPKILVLRGVFEIFSLGMNDLARKLVDHGYDAKVTSWSMALLETNCDDPRPLVVIGHSLGGRMCGWTSRKMKSCGRRMPLIIIVDANLLQSIPSNVDKCLNLYVTNQLGIFHGTPVQGESPATQIVNWDVSRGQPSMFAGGVNHFDIDSTDWVHDIIIRELDATFRQRPIAVSTVPQERTRPKHLLIMKRPEGDSRAQPPNTSVANRPELARSSRDSVSPPVRSTFRITPPSRVDMVAKSQQPINQEAWRATQHSHVEIDQYHVDSHRTPVVASQTRSNDSVAWRPRRQPRIQPVPTRIIR